MASIWDTLNQGYQAYQNNQFLSRVAVPGAISIYDQYQQNQSNKQATGQAVQGIDQGMGALNQFWQQAQQGSAPYQAFGLQGMQEYSNLMSDPNAITQSPDYQFRFAQGQQAMERSQAAKGMSLSGNTLQELQQYGQGMATTELDAALARRQPMIEAGLSSQQNLAQLGAGYAEGIGRMFQDRGATQAIGTQAGSDITSGTLRDIGGMLSDATQGASNIADQFKQANLPPGTTLENLPQGTDAMTAYNLAKETGQLMGSATAAQFTSQFNAFTQAGMGAQQAGMLAATTAEFGAEGTRLTLEAAKGATTATGAAAAAKNAASKISAWASSAPGMGIIAGIMTGLTTGDWKKGATVGLGTAGGAKLGSMVMPGIGTLIGGVLGGLLGGKIGPKPSNKAATHILDMNSGSVSDQSMTGKKRPSADQTKATTGITNSLKDMSGAIKEVFPNASFSGSLGVGVGQRDGLDVYVNGQRQTFGYGQERQWQQAIATGFNNSIQGLSPAQKDAVSRVDFSSPQLAKAQLEYIKNTVA